MSAAAAIGSILGVMLAAYGIASWPWIYRAPEPGEVWLFRGRGNGDPWGGGEPFTVTILDVRDGWVRYSMNTVFNDERKKIKTFLYCYRRAPKTTKTPAHPSYGVSGQSR
jgi:hypothetical protein